jgi:hypothetical protein
MLKIKLILLNLFVLLIFNAKTMYGQDTTITGKANNAKNGAVVVTANDEVYYIDKLSSWNPEYIDKPVRITGKVEIKKIKKPKVISGGITAPSIKVIHKPKIEYLTGGG